jgi:alkylated DNA repair protein (DNA oxidative demethylase)
VSAAGHSLFDAAAPRRERVEIAPGAVHVPDWLSAAEQIALVAACREWARPPAPMRATRLPRGGVMSARTVCLGWHWVPYRYSRIAEDTDGAPVTPMPDVLVDLGRRAVTAASGAAAGAAYAPDAALVNYYDAAARMGMHQDKDEVVAAPVVSLSLGDACTFRFGNAEHRNRPYADLTLRSGDLFVFGGPSRWAFHGVTRIHPGTADPGLDLRGRLNITIRQTGLRDATQPEVNRRRNST